jgi:di/tricarboxylate transporter
VTVALAASAAFMTPISSPVNTLVVGPGPHSFGDFVKAGVPFTIIVAIVSALLFRFSCRSNRRPVAGRQIPAPRST